MTTTEDLIHKLAKDTIPKCIRSPWCLFSIWALAAVIYAGLILAFYLHPRADLMIKFHDPLFAAEIATLLGLAVSAMYSAAVLSFPDLYQSRRVLIVPVIFFIAFCMVMAFSWGATVPANPPMPTGMECLVCITLLSVAPALLIFYQIRKMASTRPAYAGAAATLSAFAIGALTLRLSEDTNSITHIVVWHYAPMLAAAAIGICLGRKLLKW
jgi:hypothetical protein